jgi:hypothetical protein
MKILLGWYQGKIGVEERLDTEAAQQRGIRLVKLGAKIEIPIKAEVLTTNSTPLLIAIIIVISNIPNALEILQEEAVINLQVIVFTQVLNQSSRQCSLKIDRAKKRL